MVRNSRFLLDTHVFIWWMEKNKRLSKEVLNLINTSQNQTFLSVASVWEMIIKRTQKKLKLPKDIETGVKASGFTILPIEIQHVLAVERLPLHHKDPFDRMLIAQAKVEKLTIITDDTKIRKYNIDVYV